MNEMVTIPKDEYLRLKALEEDLADLQSVAEILQRLDVGEEELIPAAVVDRLLDGQAPLLVWREYRSLTQAELARRSGGRVANAVEIPLRRAPGM